LYENGSDMWRQAVRADRLVAGRGHFLSVHPETWQ
jgi:hypothetical protein